MRTRSNLKSEHLDVLLNFPFANREFMHWYHTFSSFVHCSTQVNDTDKLDMLVTFVFPSGYKYIVECNNYEPVLDILKGLYIKSKNEVFTRYVSHLKAKEKNSPISMHTCSQGWMILSTKSCILNNIVLWT